MDETAPIDSFSGEHAFLSNFFPSAIRFEGQTYPTVEHAFQAAKTSDPEERARVRDASTPARAKAVGRRVRLRAEWESVKVAIMTGFVREKFRRDEELRALLLATGERPLVEGNTWNDRFWGVVRGQGKNHLGKILMLVRAELRADVPGRRGQVAGRSGDLGPTRRRSAAYPPSPPVGVGARGSSRTSSNPLATARTRSGPSSGSTEQTE